MSAEADGAAAGAGAALGLNKLVMPKWGLSMSEGRFIAWLAEEGAAVALGDGLAEVETDKIDGIVASVMAKAVALAPEDGDGPSVYEERGFVEIEI